MTDARSRRAELPETEPSAASPPESAPPEAVSPATVPPEAAPSAAVPKGNAGRPPAAGPRLRTGWRRLGRGQQIGLVLLAVFAVLALLVTAGSHLFDEPLRHSLEGKMNQNLHGYTVRLGHAHAGLLTLSLTLRDLVVRQQANPEPPVANIPMMRLSAEWRYLFTRHLVGDVHFERPRIHADLPQLRREASDRMSPKARGWQKALESIYPLKFNSFRIDDGVIVYVDEDPQRPLEITHWNLSATNVRNIESPDGIYPSPIHTEGDIFGTGHGVIAGNANFLSQPFPGVHALYQVQKVPLDRLQQIGARSNLELHRGLLSSKGEVEYAPRYKLVQVADVLLDGVQLDYIHTAATATSERQRAKAVASAAKKAEESPLVMRLDQLHLAHGSVGYVNRAQSPNYRIFVEDASLDMLNLSNRAAQKDGQPATARLTGRFMGGGKARVVASFRPQAASADFGSEIAIEGASLPALNDVLRAHKKIDVAGGTFSVYSQVTVKNHYLHGYVKLLLLDVKVSDPAKDRNKPFSAKLKEKVIGGLAHLLENHKTDQVATRTDISGPVGSVRTSTSEILGNLLRNAFVKAIMPGFDSATGKAPAGRASRSAR